VRRGFARWAWCWFTRCHGEDAGCEAISEGDGFLDGAAEAQEDDFGVGAAGAGRVFGGLIRLWGCGFLVGLAGGEIGELRGEHDEALEYVQVAGSGLGGLLQGGCGGDGVQGVWVRGVAGTKQEHIWGWLGKGFFWGSGISHSGGSAGFGRTWPNGDWQVWNGEGKKLSFG
jgi:hypothetical protein